MIGLFEKRRFLFESALLLVTVYVFFVLSEGAVIGLEWNRAQVLNALFTIWMVGTSWWLFKKLNGLLSRTRKQLLSSTLVKTICSVSLLSCYCFLSNIFYIEVFWKEHLSETLFYSITFPFAILVFFSWNFLWFLMDKREQRDEDENLKKQEGNFSDYIISSIGKKKKIIRKKEVAFFSIKDGAVYALTFNGEQFLLDLYLTDIEKTLDTNQFFRLNRQFIVSRKAILDFTLDTNDKIKVQFIKYLGFENSAMVSRYNAPKFKSWINS